MSGGPSLKGWHDVTDRELLKAHRRYLDVAVELLDKCRLTTADPAQVALLALGTRLIQRGATAHTLCQHGYGSEADPILRSMLSALAALIYIAEKDSDARALAYFAEETRVARKRLPRLREQGVLRDEEATRLLNDSVAREVARRQEYAAKGVTYPEPASGRRWHRFPNDEQFFAALGLTRWYDGFYAGMSEDSHASAWSTVREIGAIARGEAAIGPSYMGTRFVVSASYAFVSRCLVDLDLSFDLGQQTLITAASETMRIALARSYPSRPSSRADDDARDR